MKVAIAGKDEEQFPGDTEQPPLLQASSVPPAKPTLPTSAIPHAQNPVRTPTPITRPAPKPVPTGLATTPSAR
jgi:hypothetical protein